MKNEDNKFETHHQEYEIIASSDTTEKGIQTITFNQTEYNVYLYLDRELRYPVNDGYAIRMPDGKPRTYYIKSNVDYSLKIATQKVLSNSPLHR